MRAVYDEIKGYSVSAINPFLDTTEEREYAFVDEFTCIGKWAVVGEPAVAGEPAVVGEPAVRSLAPWPRGGSQEGSALASPLFFLVFPGHAGHSQAHRSNSCRDCVCLSSHVPQAVCWFPGSGEVIQDCCMCLCVWVSRAGCKNCANCAESTFGIEDLYGRARVFNQKGDCPSKVQEAIDTWYGRVLYSPQYCSTVDC